MKLSSDAPPRGTVRDWLEARANAGGTAIVFPETGSTLDWTSLRRDAFAFSEALTVRGTRKGESVAIVAPITD